MTALQTPRLTMQRATVWRALGATALAGALLALAACGSSAPKVQPIADSSYNDYRLKGTDAGKPGQEISRGSAADKADAEALGVNVYLWRGALDTLGFMPLASADPFGGVIITDWYSPPTTTGERFKATVAILGRQLRTDGVRVSVFRQVQQDGQWVDAPLSPSTTAEIEDKVLARARELRADTHG